MMLFLSRWEDLLNNSLNTSNSSNVWTGPNNSKNNNNDNGIIENSEAFGGNQQKIIYLACI